MSRDRGVQNYAHTGETTEWEDILMKKDICTREQIFASKGLDARDVGLFLFFPPALPVSVPQAFEPGLMTLLGNSFR
jgi:hypothetical protein